MLPASLGFQRRVGLRDFRSHWPSNKTYEQEYRSSADTIIDSMMNPASPIPLETQLSGTMTIDATANLHANDFLLT